MGDGIQTPQVGGVFSPSAGLQPLPGASKSGGHAYKIEGTSFPREESAVEESQVREPAQQKNISLKDHLILWLVSFGDAITAMGSSVLTIVNLWKKKESVEGQGSLPAPTIEGDKSSLFVSAATRERASLKPSKELIHQQIEALREGIDKYVNPHAYTRGSSITEDDDITHEESKLKGLEKSLDTLNKSLEQLRTPENMFSLKAFETFCGLFEESKLEKLPPDIMKNGSFKNLQGLATAFRPKLQEMVRDERREAVWQRVQDRREHYERDEMQSPSGSSDSVEIVSKQMTPEERVFNQELYELIDKLKGIANTINPIMNTVMVGEEQSVPENPEFTRTLQEIEDLLSKNQGISLLEANKKTIAQVSCCPEKDRAQFEKIQTAISQRKQFDFNK